MFNLLKKKNKEKEKEKKLVVTGTFKLPHNSPLYRGLVKSGQIEEGAEIIVERRELV